MEDLDAIVIGAGFGGLGAALTLAERGARVALLEALTYPGGCASTFTKHGHRFESGATLFAGFDEGQLFARWIARHGMDVRLDRVDPVISFRAPGLALDVPPDRDLLIARLCAFPGAPVPAVRAFFAEQARVADLLWPCFDDPGLLPPFAPGALATHLRRLPALTGLLRYAGRPLSDVLARHGLLDWKPLVAWLDALCQITVQVGVREAEAPLALSAIDFCFRGTRHVHGGVGRLADAMGAAVQGLGGSVRYACRAKGLARDGDRWVVEGRDGPLRAPIVVANLLPQALSAMLGPTPVPRLDALAARVAEGWSATMLYLVIDPASLERAGAHHLELVQDLDRPFLDGNHLFCSVGAVDEAAEGVERARTATVSTHFPVSRLRGQPRDVQAAAVQTVQDHMRTGLRALAPDLAAGIREVLPASPRTFARFTRRPEGLVGGIPRRAGLAHYRDLWPTAVLPGLWMVGDSVFPGQSTLATAIGGVKVAEAALASR
ncbi:MAG: FAD-dependent oxidoreductase [Pseudomonadota bacterium]|nr:FAD-dependent oxidoreductase [Pseudomonadota bacterium]